MYVTRRNKIALIFLGLFWGSVYTWALWVKKQGEDFPIRAIAVEMTASPLVSESVLDKIGLWREGRLLHVNLPEIYKEIVQFPWVKAVQIWRIWPDQLKIKIEPHKIRALWRQGNTVAAVTAEGRLLTINRNMMPDGLPILEGPPDQVNAIWRVYQDLAPLFEYVQRKVVGISCVGESYWEIRLDNRIAIILGKEDVNAQVRRLIRVLQQPLKGLVNRIAYIDLRYPSGLAVGWKD